MFFSLQFGQHKAYWRCPEMCKNAHHDHVLMSESIIWKMVNAVWCMTENHYAWCQTICAYHFRTTWADACNRVLFRNFQGVIRNCFGPDVWSKCKIRPTTHTVAGVSAHILNILRLLQCDANRFENVQRANVIDSMRIEPSEHFYFTYPTFLQKFVVCN